MMYPNYSTNYNPYNRANDIQYVNGLESAKAYPMSPNQSAILMDSTDSKFYVKRTDASGFSDIKTFVFTEYREETPKVENYVQRAEFEDLRDQLNNLSKLMEKSARGQNKGTKGGTEE